MDDKLTRKSQEALSDAVQRAAADGQPARRGAAPAGRAARARTAAPRRRCSRAVGADPAARAQQAGAADRPAAQARRRPRSARRTRPGRCWRRWPPRPSGRSELDDEYVSTEHLLVGLAADGGQAATLLRERGATPDALLDAFEQVRGSARVTTEDPEDTYQALEKYGIDLTAAGPRRQARPGHRPGRRDPAGDPGAVPPHQEQPGAHRRAGRRQDRRGRGPGPADRRR